MKTEPQQAVVVFAKVPGKANPKSRIAAEVGREQADEIYRELLMATAQQVHGFTHFVSYTGSTDPGSLREFFPGAQAFLAQRGESLGQRVENALCEVSEQGFARVCALGTDCPSLTGEEINRALALLEKQEVVMGPAEDGGYYLIALKDPRLGVFSVQGWGTSGLLRETEELLNEKKLPYALLKTREDVDTWAAYQRWKNLRD